MTSSRPISWSHVSAPDLWTRPFRRLLAVALRRSSAVLARMARRLAQPAPITDPLPTILEFYADSGAPEGALYVNGHLVGWIPGVKRL